VIFGCLKIRKLKLPFLCGKKELTIQLGASKIDFEADDISIHFKNDILISESMPLIIKYT